MSLTIHRGDAYFVENEGVSMVSNGIRVRLMENKTVSIEIIKPEELKIMLNGEAVEFKVKEHK